MIILSRKKYEDLLNEIGTINARSILNEVMIKQIDCEHPIVQREMECQYYSMDADFIPPMVEKCNKCGKKLNYFEGKSGRKRQVDIHKEKARFYEGLENDNT